MDFCRCLKLRGWNKVKYNTLRYEKIENMGVVTFSNPEKLNALTAEFLDEYSSLLDIIEADPKVHVVVLTGEGKAFIAGADIELMSTMTPQEAAANALQTTEIYRRMENMGKIFIAAINGYALGGGSEMAMACDLRIASKKAKLGFPEVSLGIFPGGGGTQRLPRLIGMTKAKELVYTGRIISADEAEQIGLLNAVVSPEKLMDRTVKLADEIMKNSHSAVSLAKEAMNNGMQIDLNSAELQAKNLYALCYTTKDQREGMNAFLEKRPAVFEGNK